MAGEVNVTFYFDFADVRSWMVAAQVRDFALRFPVRIQLFPINANALNAFLGSATRTLDPVAQTYLEQDATRWARHALIPLHWPTVPHTSGPALRVALWLAEHEPDRALDVVLDIFDTIWASGERLGEGVVRGALEKAGIDPDPPLRYAARTEAFPAFEAAVELAVADGIFEVPTLRVGTSSDFVGFDRFAQVERAVLEQLLASAPPAELSRLAAALLHEAPVERRAALVGSLGRERRVEFESDEPRNPRFDGIAGVIRLLPAVDGRWEIPVAGLPVPLRLGLVASGPPNAPIAVGVELRDLIARSADRALIGGPAPLLINQVDETLGSLQQIVGRKRTDVEGMLVPVLAEGKRGLLHLSPRPAGSSGVHLRIVTSELGPDGELAPLVLGSGRVGYVPREFRRDTNVHRKLAWSGAHVLIVENVEPGDVSMVASAIACGRWIVTTGERICLYDADGRYTVHDWPAGNSPLPLDLPWPPRHPGEAETWKPDPPRTMLVTERPLTLGSVGDGGDVGLAVAGNGITIRGGGVTSTLSPTQPFSALRHGFTTLLAIPVHGAEIAAAELVSTKLLDALSRRRRNARLLVINYWTDLNYDDLVRMRPVLADTARRHRAPVLLVIGSRPVELWTSEENGSVYRLEQDGDLFKIDLVQQPSMQQRRDRFVSEIDDLDGYLAMLKSLRVS